MTRNREWVRYDFHYDNVPKVIDNKIDWLIIPCQRNLKRMKTEKVEMNHKV